MVFHALTAEAQLTITQQPTDLVITNGGTALFNILVSGTAPFSYQWLFNSNNLPPFIATVAGNGLSGYSGDGNTATNAKLNYPSGVAVDKAGNLFIADYISECVRKVSTDRIITTVAGNGTFGYSGDGGPGTNAVLDSPHGVAVDNLGNLFIADSGNHRIRKLDTNGMITTVAGPGAYGTTGDGGRATNAWLWLPTSVALDNSGNIYIADYDDSRIRMVNTNGIITTIAGNGTAGFSGDGGAGTNAMVSWPYGIAVGGSGNVFIADYGNERIRKVDTNGVITTVAGNGTYIYLGDGGLAINAAFSCPQGIAVDAVGNLLIADQRNNRIRKVDTNGIITTAAGNSGIGFSSDGNIATNASLYWPSGVTIDNTGNVFIADTYNSRIREVYPINQSTLPIIKVTSSNIGSYSVIVTSAEGSVTSSPASLNMFPFFTASAGNPNILAGLSTVLSVRAGGSLPLMFQWAFNGTNIVGATNSSYAINNTSTNNGGVYMVIVTNPFGSKTNSSALTVSYISQQPAAQLIINGGTALFTVTLSSAGPFSYQWQFNGTNLPAGTIKTVAGNSALSSGGDGGLATSAGMWSPFGVALDTNGNFYIADYYNSRIRKVTTNGIISTVAGTGTSGYSGDGYAATSAMLNNPVGVATDNAGNVFIADTANNRIRKVDASGVITTVVGYYGYAGYGGDGGLARFATLYHPYGITIDKAGSLFIADYSNNRIRKVGTNGIITTIAGNGVNGFSGDGGAATNAKLYNPTGVAYDAAGNILIADYNNNRVRMVSTNGIITTRIGNGIAGYAGDGGAATNSKLYNPFSIILNTAGDLFVADSKNNRIREIGTNGIVATVVGGGSHTYPSIGDGGAPINAKLASPSGLTIDSLGNLFIADSGNNCIRRASIPPYPTTLSTLTIDNVSSINAGNYSVIISNPSGSITSSIAALTAILPQSSFIIKTGDNGLQIQILGTPNYPYILQSATNLTPPVNWQTVLTNPADGNGNWQFTDSNLNNGQKFYRAVGQ